MGLLSNSSKPYQFEIPIAPLPLIRHLSYPVTRLLLLTPMTPNQITALSLVFGELEFSFSREVIYPY